VDRTIRTEIRVDAPPSVVWAVLSDVERYPKWNPTVVDLRGRLREGARLAGRLVLPGLAPIPFSPRLVVVSPRRELRWRARVGTFFRGEHAFLIEPIDRGGSLFVQEERFDGLAVDAGLAVLRSRIVEAFEAMDRALKDEAERLAENGSVSPEA
jgi:hypothetical protein